MLTRRGIDVGEVVISVGVRVCRGFVRHPDGTVQRQYDPEDIEVPLQVRVEGAVQGRTP